MLKDISSYTANNLLDTVFNKTRMAMRSTSLEELENIFLTRIPDDQKDETWFFLKCQGDKSVYITNNTYAEDITVEENQTGEVVSWSYINLYDKSWNLDTKLYPPIEKIFTDIISDLKNLPGIKIAGLHFARPHTSILPHADYVSEEQSKNIVYVIESGGVTLTSGKNVYTVLENQSFVFDASIEHSVKNPTDKNFIVLTLRIDSNFFIDND